MKNRSPAQMKAYRANWRVIIMRTRVYGRVTDDRQPGESRGDVIERWAREHEKAKEEKHGH